MENVLKYKNFIATVHYSDQDEAFVGKVEGINSVIVFEGQTVAELKQAFKESIEDYLDFCNRKGLAPQKSLTGSFNIRLTSDLHYRAVLAAKTMGTTLNGFVKKAVEDELKKVSLI